MITETNCFWNYLDLSKKCEQRITESLSELFWEFYLVIWVEELPNRNCFGINSGWPRLGSVRVRFGDGNGSSSSGFRFRRFLCKKGFSVFQYSLTGKDGSGFGSWKTVPAVPVPLSVSGKTVPTVPVSGSGSVPEPPC